MTRMDGVTPGPRPRLTAGPKLGWAGLGAAIVAIGLGACTSSATGPTPVVGDSILSVVVGDSLRIRLEVSEVSIVPGGQFTAVVSVENLTAREIVLTSSCTSLLAVEIVRGDTSVGFEGTENGCGFALTDFPIGEAAAVTVTRDLRAAFLDGGDAEPGVYSVRIELLVPGLPRLELPIEVSRAR